MMLFVFVVIIVNFILGFAAAVALGYGPPGLAEIWVATSGEIARHHVATADDTGQIASAVAQKGGQPADSSTSDSNATGSTPQIESGAQPMFQT